MPIIYGTTGPDTRNGTQGNDTIYGWATGGNINSPSANDTLNGNAGNDNLNGGTGEDSLYGGPGLDTLNGGAGNDTLDGGSGSDTLNGGTGNDTYIIDSTPDTVTEAVNSGTDNVQSYVSYTLSSNLENLTLLGISASNGIGNSLNNKIIGTDANNILNARAGNDTVYGDQSSPYSSGGDDTLNGDDGNDILYGDSQSGSSYNSGGNDILDGGDGNDILFGDYQSGSSYSGNDTLNGGNGNDTLYGDSDSSLGGSDILYGDAGDDVLGGDSGNDTLDGGNGNDTLNGGNGNDTLNGGSGNDTYIIDTTDDTITEAANSGIDTVQSSVSYTLGSNLNNLTLTGSDQINGTGNSLNNTIIGNDANNIIFGGTGNDNLNGRAGNDTILGSSGSVGEKDTLTGGLGIDTFILGNATQVLYDDGNTASSGTGDYALITDFNTSVDIIRLNGTKNNYVLAASPVGLPKGTAIYRTQPSGKPNELIAIVQGSSSLSLNGNYFRFTSTEINLSTLNGSNGFVLNGIDAGDNSGGSVSSGGDINGDGFDDILIGADQAGAKDSDERYAAGESYVVFGKAEGFSANFNLSTLNGSNGFVLNGIDTHDSSGSVSSAGDVNGDDFDDLIIGAPSASPNGQRNAGESYVVFGKAKEFSSSLNLSALNGSNGFVINGIDADDISGSSVSPAGDVNGDGFSDLIIGARYADSNGQKSNGQSYVVFGAGGFNSTLNLSSLNGSNGFAINGIESGDRLGVSVSSAGDVNNDGFDDLLIGAAYTAPNEQVQAGSTYVVFGKAGGFSSNLNLSSLNGGNGFAINGINAQDFSGSSVSAAGDVNGDGFADILIAADGADLSTYVVFGKAEGFSSSLNLSSLNGSNGFVINGIEPGDRSNSSVSSAGDVNGDGFSDLLIAAPSSAPNGEVDAGKSYVVFGKANFSSSLNLSAINGTNGFVINGINAQDFSGTSVSSAGDVNGDGFDDLLLGVPSADPKGQVDAGESYVIFGRDFTGQVTRAGTRGNDSLTGTASNDVLIGGLGNDILVGSFGNDVLLGGGGNDTLSFDTADRRISGGSGTDTLRIDGSGVKLDLTTVSNNKLTGFEQIDLTGTGNNSLTFNRLDVLALSDTTNQLIINGNTGDAVISMGQGWTRGGTTTLDNILYNRYTIGAATLLVGTDITQTMIT